MSDNPWATQGEYQEEIARQKKLLDLAISTNKATIEAAGWAKWAAIAAIIAAAAAVAAAAAALIQAAK